MSNTYLDLFLFKVSTKQSEIGIGQISLEYNRFKLVDYLPPMIANTWFITYQKPKEIISFDSIIIPFDKYVWIFTFVCICAQFLLLVIMQHLYSHLTGMKYTNDYIYEGNNAKSEPL